MLQKSVTKFLAGGTDGVHIVKFLESKDTPRAGYLKLCPALRMGDTFALSASVLPSL